MRVKLTNVRIAFPKLFEAEAIAGGTNKYYSCALLFAKDSQAYKALNEAMETAAKDKWGQKADAVMKALRADPSKLCLKNGDSKGDYDGYAGNYFINASRQERKGKPRTLNNDKSNLTEKQAGRIYAGCYVDAVVEIWSQDNAYGKKINCELLGVQYRGAGDSFAAGGVASDDDFDSIEAPAEDDLA